MSLPEGFEEAVLSMSNEEILDRLGKLTLAILEQQRLMKQDEKLLQAKKLAKELREVYTGPINEIKPQLAFCKKVLDDRGLDLSASTDEE